MNAIVSSILTALVKAGLEILVNKICAAVSAWYISRQEEATLVEISDTVAFALGAKTDEERMEVSRRWHRVLSRPRVQE